MKKILILGITLIISSCSSSKIQRIMSKKLDIQFEKSKDFKAFSKYTQDAVVLTEMVKYTYPKLNTKISGEQFKFACENYINESQKIKDKFSFEILSQRFLAQLKDGHSSISFSPYKKKELYPFYLFKEKDGWKVLNINKSQDSTLIGSNLVSINGFSITEIEKKVEAFESGENSNYRLHSFWWKIQLPKYLEAIGLTDSSKSLNVKTEKEGKVYSFQLSPLKKRTYYNVKALDNKYPLTDKQNEGFYTHVSQEKNFAYLQMNTCLDFVALKDGIGNYTNFFTRPLAMMYLKSVNKDAKNFGKTLQTLFKEIQIKNVDNLIVDLRYNSGGDERLGKQIIWYLTESDSIKGFKEYLQVSDYFKKHVKNDYKYYNTLHQQKYGTPMPTGELNITNSLFNEPYFENITRDEDPFLLDNSIPKFKGKVYVIIGTYTFSAANILATTLSDNSLATLVGTPTGNRPSTQTGASGFKLPKTKTVGTISYTYMERPDKEKNEENALYPDIETYPTFETAIEGNDVAFDYIMNDISKQNVKN